MKIDILKNFWQRAWWSKLILIGLGLFLWPFVIGGGLSFLIAKKIKIPLLKWFLILPIVAFSLLFGSAWVMAITSSQTYKSEPKSVNLVIPSPTSSPSPTPVSESFPTVTPTLIPTIEPTIIPTVKPTTRPTNSPTPTPEEDYSSYVNKITEILDDFREVSKTFGETLSKYPDYSIRDTYTLAAYSTVLEMYYDKFNAIQPPLKFKNVHQKLINFAKLYKDAMPMIRQGIDEDNYNLINQATVKINTANDIMEQAAKEIEKMAQ